MRFVPSLSICVGGNARVSACTHSPTLRINLVEGGTMGAGLRKKVC